MDYGAQARPLTLYKCALCEAQKPTHKRNNVEQHIWKHHGEHHGFDSRLYKYRVQEHKAYVAPFILTTTMDTIDPFMQKYPVEYGAGARGYPNDVPPGAGMTPMGPLTARREYSGPPGKGSTTMMYTCSLCKVLKPTNKRNNVEQHIWSHHPETVGFDTARLKYRAGEHKAVVTPYVVAIEVDDPPIPLGRIPTPHAIQQQPSLAQYAPPPTVSVTHYDARMRAAAVASNGKVPGQWASPQGSLDARAVQSMFDTTHAPQHPQVMRPYSMPGRFAAGPFASNPLVTVSRTHDESPSYEAYGRPHSSMASYGAQPTVSLPPTQDAYTSGGSTPNAFSPSAVQEMARGPGPVRPVLNSSLSNPGYEIKSRYSPTMDGPSHQNQNQNHAQAHQARWRPY